MSICQWQSKLFDLINRFSIKSGRLSIVVKCNRAIAPNTLCNMNRGLWILYRFSCTQQKKWFTENVVLRCDFVCYFFLLQLSTPLAFHFCFKCVTRVFLGFYFKSNSIRCCCRLYDMYVFSMAQNAMKWFELLFIVFTRIHKTKYLFKTSWNENSDENKKNKTVSSYSGLR